MKGIKFIVIFISVLSHEAAHSQKPGTDVAIPSLRMDSIVKQGAEYDLINNLIGSWSVIQINHSKESGAILHQDTFKVERKMVGNFLQEIMVPLIKNKDSFTRISYLNYNRTNLRWEYIVLDTRYPIMMFETSTVPTMLGDSITLNLDAFIVPPFVGSKYAGMLAKERRVIIFKNQSTYLHKQYWTLPGDKEFLAIEYIFKKQ